MYFVQKLDTPERAVVAEYDIVRARYIAVSERQGRIRQYLDMRVLVFHTTQEMSRAGRFSRALFANNHDNAAVRERVRVFIEHVQNYPFREVLE